MVERWMGGLEEEMLNTSVMKVLRSTPSRLSSCRLGELKLCLCECSSILYLLCLIVHLISWHDRLYEAGAVDGQAAMIVITR